VLLALAAAPGCSPPWTVRPIESAKSDAPQAGISDPAAWVDSIWSSKLLPAVEQGAVDARVLLDAWKSSPEQTEMRFGRRETNGPVYFLVKGAGTVVSVDQRSRNGLALVDFAPFDGRPDLSIQIGPVLRGTSLRDATGLVRFNDFLNQLQYADAANALNERVLAQVLAQLDVPRLKGRRVSFAGTLAADRKADPPLSGVIPVRLTTEERAQ
jgi:predicted lipoprotein